MPGETNAPARRGISVRPALAAIAGIGLALSLTPTSAQWADTASVAGTVATVPAEGGELAESNEGVDGEPESTGDEPGTDEGYGDPDGTGDESSEGDQDERVDDGSDDDGRENLDEDADGRQDGDASR